MSLVVYFSKAQGLLRARSGRKGFTPAFRKTRRFVRMAAHSPRLAAELYALGSVVYWDLQARGAVSADILTAIRQQLEVVKEIADSWKETHEDKD